MTIGGVARAAGMILAGMGMINPAMANRASLGMVNPGTEIRGRTMGRHPVSPATPAVRAMPLPSIVHRRAAHREVGVPMAAMTMQAIGQVEPRLGVAAMTAIMTMAIEATGQPQGVC